MSARSLLLIILVYLCITSVYYYYHTTHVPKAWNSKFIGHHTKPLNTLANLEAIPSYELFRYSKAKRKALSSKPNNFVRSVLKDKGVEDLCAEFAFKPLMLPHAKPRLFYGMLFNNEIDILEISLREMYDSLYCLVIIESDVTFTGLPRTMNFLNYSERLKPYADKIVYIPYVGNPADVFNHVEGAAYGREVDIRDSIRNAWIKLGMRATDLAIVGDADEILSYRFVAALSVCNVFPVQASLYASTQRKMDTDTFDDIFDVDKYEVTYPVSQIHSQPLAASRGTLSLDTITERCNNRTKLMARIDVFSSYLDCPLVAQYWTNPEIFPGIKMYWHPDIVPGECVLHADITNITVENLRTMGGSRRLMKWSVGWHYRNQRMSAEEVYFKYQTYGHPEQSPLGVYYNITAAQMNLTHVNAERARDCQHRERLLLGSGMRLNQLPLLLQDRVQRQRYRDLFFNYSQFYQWMERDRD